MSNSQAEYVVDFDSSMSSREIYELKEWYAYSCGVPLRTCAIHLMPCQVGSGDKAVSKQLLAMGVTDRSILIFLAQIEEQIEHIVQVKIFC